MSSDGDRLPGQPVPDRDAGDGGGDARLVGSERDGRHPGAHLASGRRRGSRGGHAVLGPAERQVTDRRQQQHQRGPDDGNGP